MMNEMYNRVIATLTLHVQAICSDAIIRAIRNFIHPIAYKKSETLNIFTVYNITNIISNIVK